MTRPNGGWRCSYGAWHDLYETCKCWETNAAVMAAAFPDHDRMLTREADSAASMVAAHYRNRIAVEDELRGQYADDETFSWEVQRVMWEQNVSASTAVHVAGASRRLAANKAARAAA